MAEHLLPTNSTPLEMALSLAIATDDLNSPVSAVRGTKLVAPFPSMLPFLVYEYGLGELTPYVPNLYNLIEEGIEWQRVRGTPKAMELALAWVGYTALIEPESVRRRFWNLFQLELDRVRDEPADLDRIAGVAALSVPRRSKFWRGFHGFDIRPLSYAHGSWGESHFGEYSGVRLRPSAPLWSFGREYEFAHTIGQADLEAVGIDWIEPVEGADIGWGDFSWDDTDESWESDTVRARATELSSDFGARRAWFRFDDAAGEVIGYRRARAFHFVAPAISGGHYTLDGQPYRQTSNAEPVMYAEALTGFGDAAGEVAASVSLVLDGVPSASGRQGARWLAPDEITGQSAPVLTTPISIEFGESIRERVKFLIQF